MDNDAAPEPDGAGPVFDPFDPRWADDPFPLYAELRAHAPAHRSPAGFWVFSRHADCLAVLRDRVASVEEETVDPSRLSERFRGPDRSDDPVAQALADARPFLFRDPPDHTRLRGLVAKAFTPKVVESLRGPTQRLVDRLLDEALARGEVDLVAAFAYPLPVTVICDLLGIPEGDRGRFTGWSAALARGLDPDFLLGPDAVHQRLEAILQFAEYFTHLIAARRSDPGDDLLSALALAEEHGAVLSEGELLSTCILLRVAGHETTVNLIGGGVHALLDQPDALADLRDHPDLVRRGVDELLRFVSPVQLTGRSFLEDVTVGDADVEAGDFAMLLLASANRDADVFEDPDRLHLGRSPNNHLGFGFGLHHCLGAPLARMEAQLAIGTLVRRCPDLALAGDVAYHGTVVLRGPSSLPVRLLA